jgi:heme/copper-type cytochrome/quinol oxidase subunit 2
LKYGCLNVGCRDVFGQWISGKLRNLALVGFTATAIYIVTVGMSISMWRRLSNGSERIMWHNKILESLFIVGSILLILAGGILSGVVLP